MYTYLNPSYIEYNFYSYFKTKNNTNIKKTEQNEKTKQNEKTEQNEKTKKTLIYKILDL